MVHFSDTSKRVSLSQRDSVMGHTTPMGRMGRGEIDEQVREHIREWIRYEMVKRQIDSIRDFSRRIHASHSYVSRILLGEATPGMELCLRMRRYLHVSVDAMIDGPPPKL